MTKVILFPQRRSKSFQFTNHELRNMMASVYYEGSRTRTQAESNELKRQFINDLVLNSRRFLVWALLLLLSYQTPRERKRRSTIDPNRQGLSKFNAPKFSAIGDRFEATSRLTQEDAEILLKPLKLGPRIAKYWRQIFEALEEQLLAKEAA